MSINASNVEYTFNITMLGHPDIIVTRMIQNLTQIYPLYPDNEHAAKVFNFHLTIKDRLIKIIIIQPTGSHIIDKLLNHYYESIDGAVILFSMNYDGSFQAAQAFYRKLRKTNRDQSVPVSFIEITSEKMTTVIEPESLEGNPTVIYYVVQDNDQETFQKILEFITSKQL